MMIASKTAFIPIAIIFAIAGAPGVLGEGALRFLTECCLMLVMAQMWNLLAGYAGLVSFGHQVFVGIGAYALFMATGYFGVSPYWTLPLAPLVCALIGAAISIPLFRLRDAYFAIAMWVFSEIIAALVTKSAFLSGTAGLTLSVAGRVNFDWFETVIFWISASFALAVIVGLYFLMRSSFGLGLISVRDNDLAAMSVGVDVRMNRFIAFVLSAAGCGLAGALSFMGSLYVSPSPAFDVNWVVAMMFIVIIGGIGTLEGPIFGVVIYFAIRELMTGLFGLSAGWYLIALGAVAVSVMLFCPRGLWPELRDRFGIELMSVRRKTPA